MKLRRVQQLMLLILGLALSGCATQARAQREPSNHRVGPLDRALEDENNWKVNRAPLTRSDVAQGMGLARAAAQECLDRYGVPGTYHIDVVIKRDGWPLLVRPTNRLQYNNSARHQPTLDCICQAVREHARFRTFEGPGTISIIWPYELKAPAAR